MIIWLASLAIAQTPDVTPAVAQTLYVVGDAPVDAKRFVDAEPGSAAAVMVGTSGTVIYRENGWVRLHLADRFVWVPESSTSPDAPGLSLEGIDLGGLGLEGLNLGEGLKMGEGLKLSDGLKLGN